MKQKVLAIIFVEVIVWVLYLGSLLITLSMLPKGEILSNLNTTGIIVFVMWSYIGLAVTSRLAFRWLK